MVNSPFTALSYDPLDRLAIIDSSTDAKFAYDGTDTLAEYDGSNVLQHRYVFGPGMDEPIVEYDSSGNRRFLSADERGSIISASDSSGVLLGIDAYDEYGRPGSGNSGRFQYTGQKWIGEAGLYDYKARSYLAHLGIFAQTDPIGYDAGANLYAYVLNDPVNMVDPSGLVSPGCPQPPGEIGVCGHRPGSGGDGLDPGGSGGGGGGGLLRGPFPELAKAIGTPCNPALRGKRDFTGEVLDEEDATFAAIGHVADAAVVVGYVIAPVNPALGAVLIVGGKVAGNFSGAVQLGTAVGDYYHTGNTSRLISASGRLLGQFVGGRFGARLGARIFGNQQIRNSLGQFGGKRALAGFFAGRNVGGSIGGATCPTRQ